MTWSVMEVGGGSVDASGLYTAPGTPGTYHVVATSQADWGKSDTATVTVNAGNPVISVTIDAPKTVTVAASATHQFQATVTGTSNTAVTWNVMEVGGGSVDASGLYTAPGTPGTYHVVATSQADSSKSDTATATVEGISPRPGAWSDFNMSFYVSADGSQSRIPAVR